MPSHLPGFLASGPAQPLPYPGFPEVAHRVVLQAVVAAWEGVCTTAVARTVPRKEVPITVELQQQLNRMLNEEASTVPGFTASIFETVIRGGEIENVDESSMERRPDRTFRLAGTSPARTTREHYGMFTECKLLDSTHSLNAYCETGLRRFLQSEYAWAMPHALMLAYADTDSTPADLAIHLASEDANGTIGTPAVDVPPPSAGVRSRHARERAGIAAASGPIDITHVWLSLRVAGP